jgi:hypothetical protein
VLILLSKYKLGIDGNTCYKNLQPCKWERCDRERSSLLHQSSPYICEKKVPQNVGYEPLEDSQDELGNVALLQR